MTRYLLDANVFIQAKNLRARRAASASRHPSRVGSAETAMAAVEESAAAFDWQGNRPWVILQVDSTRAISEAAAIPSTGTRSQIR